MKLASLRAIAACITVLAVAPAIPARAATVPGVPRFFNYVSPPGVGDDAGEPTFGVNETTEQTFSNSNGPIPNGGTVNYFGGFLPYMLKVTFNDCQSPAQATWDQKTLLTANSPRVYGDPILYTDRTQGRTLVSQLEGLTPAGSTTDGTDDDGDNIFPTEGSGLHSRRARAFLGGSGSVGADRRGGLLRDPRPGGGECGEDAGRAHALVSRLESHVNAASGSPS